MQLSKIKINKKIIKKELVAMKCKYNSEVNFSCLATVCALATGRMGMSLSQKTPNVRLR